MSLLRFVRAQTSSNVPPPPPQKRSFSSTPPATQRFKCLSPTSSPSASSTLRSTSSTLSSTSQSTSSTSSTSPSTSPSTSSTSLSTSSTSPSTLSTSPSTSHSASVSPPHKKSRAPDSPTQFDSRSSDESSYEPTDSPGTSPTPPTKERKKKTTLLPSLPTSSPPPLQTPSPPPPSSSLLSPPVRLSVKATRKPPQPRARKPNSFYHFFKATNDPVRQFSFLPSFFFFKSF